MSEVTKIQKDEQAGAAPATNTTVKETASTHKFIYSWDGKRALNYSGELAVLMKDDLKECQFVTIDSLKIIWFSEKSGASITACVDSENRTLTRVEAGFMPVSIRAGTNDIDKSKRFTEDMIIPSIVSKQVLPAATVQAPKAKLYIWADEGVEVAIEINATNVGQIYKLRALKCQ